MNAMKLVASHAYKQGLVAIFKSEKWPEKSENWEKKQKQAKKKAPPAPFFKSWTSMGRLLCGRHQNAIDHMHHTIGGHDVGTLNHGVLNRHKLA